MFKTGAEFFEYYTQIEEITDIEWEYSGSGWDPQDVKVVFTIDGKTVSINYPIPMLPTEERELNYVMISMLVNKCLRDLTGKTSTFMTIHTDGVTSANTISTTINYVRDLLREKIK